MKYPDTVKRIEKYLRIVTEFERMASESEILKDISEPIGSVLSEGASRPLHSLKGEDLEKALRLIVKKAEEKVENEEDKISVTNKELAEIVNKIVPPKAPKAASMDPIKAKLEKAFTNVPDDAINKTIERIDELSTISADKKKDLKKRKRELSVESGYSSQQQEAPA